MFSAFEITYTDSNNEKRNMLVIAETMIGALQTFKDNIELNPTDCREIQRFSGMVLVESNN